MASTVPAAKAALKGLLEAHTWTGNQPDIRWATPTSEADLSQNGELIFFGDTTISDTSPTLGQTRYDEEFSLRLTIDVIQYGNDPQATEERAWALYGEVVHVLDAHKNPALDGAINRFTDRSVRQITEPYSPEQWATRIVVEQGCVGFITNP